MRVILSLVVLFAQNTLGQAPQSSAPAILVKAARMLDPRTGNVLSPAAVLIEGDRVKEVGPPAQLQSHAPADVKTIDLGRHLAARAD
jgi:hypothetical protein